MSALIATEHKRIKAKPDIKMFFRQLNIAGTYA